MTDAWPARPSMLGPYGPWLAQLPPEPPLLSLRRGEWGDVEAWKRAAVAKVRELLASPEGMRSSPPRVTGRMRRDGLRIEELEWSLPYGLPTRALFIVPDPRRGRLPGFLALHDHGGMKYFGKQKIVRLARVPQPLVEEHQRLCYGGRGWANELARRGYAVMVHDTFPFESRRIRYDEVPKELSGMAVEHEQPTIEEVIAYNHWAGEQESVVARSLSAAGTTWAGITFAEDTIALEHLLAREEVDPDRVGCGGLSGGGMRTVYLAGLDSRIRAAFCAGFMTTWRDFVLHKSYTHTWMAYVSLLPRYLDFPEVLALRAPLPTLVMNCAEDDLYTPAEVEKAAGILREVYGMAGAPAEIEVQSYPGPHRFDGQMQEDAFLWLDRTLKG